jgi:hypothetical protein
VEIVRGTDVDPCTETEHDAVLVLTESVTVTVTPKLPLEDGVKVAVDPEPYARVHEKLGVPVAPWTDAVKVTNWPT